MTAATGVHFGHPTNRFWPALQAAGLVEVLPSLVPHAAAVPIVPPAFPGELPPGRMPFNDGVGRDFAARGMGITNLVGRATARASELGALELREGGTRLLERVVEISPAVVAIAGVTAYRAAFGNRRADLGRQEERLGDAELWVVPNPSGLNAHETVESLAGWYGAAADAAGIDR